MHTDDSPRLFIQCKRLPVGKMSGRIINDARPLITVQLHASKLPQIIRSRNACVYLGAGSGQRRLITKTAGARSILVIRDPRDTVLSLKHYYNWSFHKALSFVRSPEARLEPPEVAIPSHPLDWVTFNKSWIRGMEPLVLRQEDIAVDPKTAFTRVLRHLDIPLSHERANRALNYASFPAQHEWEKKYNAKHEGRKHAPLVYQNGKPGGYFLHVPSRHHKEIDRCLKALYTDLAPTLRQFGYKS